MINSERKETAVGALTIGALLLALFAAYGLPESDKTQNEYQVSAVFSRIDGLADDAEVRMGGVQVGQVSMQKLDQDYRAVITMNINKDIALPLDTSAAIHTDGLFGGKFIELEPGGEEDMLSDGGKIDMTQSSVVVEELLELIISEGKAKRAAKEE